MVKRLEVPEAVRDCLEYDAESGMLTWIATTRPGFVGREAGTLSVNGYINVNFRGASYKAHRIAWFLHTGEQPPDLIDHISGDTSDNSWSNLREATFEQNNAYSRDRMSFTGLPRGVTRRKGGYVASIGVDGYLGFFRTSAAASQAYQTAFNARYGSEWNINSRQPATTS